MPMNKIKISLIITLLVFAVGEVSAATVNPVLMDALGYSNYVSGNYSIAMDCYQKTLNVMPTSAVAFDGIGDIFAKNKDYYKAHLSYKKASSMSPSNSIYKLHAQRAIYLALIESMKNPKNYPTDKQKIKQSIAYIQKITVYEPENICAKKLLCDFYILDNDHQSALRTALSAIEVSDNNYELNKKISDIYISLNKPKESLLYLQKADKIRKNAEKIY